MKIRPARPEDAPTLKALLQENGQAVDGITYDVFSPPVLVAEEAGEVVGFIQALVGEPYTVITDLVVARSLANRGIGVRLGQHMETVLRVLGCRVWVAYAGEKHEGMREQLERYGARPTGHGVGFVRAL